ncbi:hypothetical protein CHARACLAT_009901, partial [Characodon lateralis]|nr:hypothetical protein [Characodon lateralis]
HLIERTNLPGNRSVLESRSSLSFLPGSVLVFRAPPEGPWLGGRGVGGGLAPLCSFLPPPQGARHSMYHWQAKPDNETACTANAVFEQGRGLPRHAEHTRAGRPTRTRKKPTYGCARISTRQAPGGFDTCSEDAAEVRSSEGAISTQF